MHGMITNVMITTRPDTPDLSHHGKWARATATLALTRRYGEAELRQLAVDPAVSPQRILLRQPDGKAGDAPGCRRTTGLALLARVVLSRGQSAVPGQQRRRRHGEDPCPAPPGEEPRQHREPQPVSRVVPDPADVAAEHRVLVPEHQQLSSLCPVTAEHQPSRTEDPARQQVDDLEQHL